MDNNNNKGSCCSTKSDTSCETGCKTSGCVSKIIKGMIFGGIVFYAVNAISWTMLPFHMETMNAFTNTAQVSKVLNDNTTVDGTYMLPFPEMKKEETVEKVAATAEKVKAKAEQAVAKDGSAAKAKAEAKEKQADAKKAAADAKPAEVQKPYAFVTIIKEGIDPAKMSKQVFHHIILSLLLAGILTCVLKRLASGVCPVMTSAKVGLFSALIATAPGVIWFGFPCKAAFLNGVDIFVATALAGLVIGKFVLNMPICCSKGSCCK